MANLTVNLIFASIFGGFAWNSLIRGWRYFRPGWIAFRSKQEKLDESNVGSNFLIAGIAWLVGGIISALLTVMFVLFAIFDIGIFDLLS